MRLFAVFFVIACMIVYVTCAFRTTSSEEDRRVDEGPRSLTWVFGTVVSGEVVNGSFHLTNPTGRSVPILSISPDCSCTNVGDWPKEIPVNGMVLPVKMDTGGMNGEVTRTIRLQLKDEAPLNLLLKGSVIEQCPQTIQLGQIRRGEIRKKTFVLRSAQKMQATALRTKYNIDWLKVKLRPVDDASVEVLVETSSVIPEGPFDIPLTFYLSQVGESMCQTRIQGHVLRRVEVNRDRLVLSSLEEGTDMVGSVRVFSPYGEKFSVKSVKCTDGNNLTAIPSLSGEQATIDVAVNYHVPHDQSQGVFINGTVKIVTEMDGAAYPIEVLVFGLINAPKSR